MADPCNCDQALQLAARVAELEAEAKDRKTTHQRNAVFRFLTEQRDTARAEAAAMREAFLEYIRICGPTADHHPDDCDVAGGCEYCRADARANAVLASGAGSALLERLRLAESEALALRDGTVRLADIVDDAFGLQPVQSPDELLTTLERLLFERRLTSERDTARADLATAHRRIDEAQAALERQRVLLAEALGWTTDASWSSMVDAVREGMLHNRRLLAGKT